MALLPGKELESKLRLFIRVEDANLDLGYGDRGLQDWCCPSRGARLVPTAQDRKKFPFRSKAPSGFAPRCHLGGACC